MLHVSIGLESSAHRVLARRYRHVLGIAVLLGAVLWVPSLGCKADIGDPRRGLGTGPMGFGGDGALAGAANGASAQAATAADAAMRAANPSLFEISLKYFPGGVPTAGAKRLFRLTRPQLDVTTKALLPTHYTTSAVATMPRDPLQTNYEYADNLSFNAANFTPYTSWIEQLAASVKLNPASVIDCAATNNATSCLEDQAKKFVTRAFRGVVSDATLLRYSTFFLGSVPQVGLPDATADLVNLALTAPGYVFRDEVQTMSGVLSPAQQLQTISYTLADAPPEAVGLSSATAAAQLSTPDGMQRTIDQVLATPAARDKLLRFFISWLEVKAPDEFILDPSVFPEFTPALAAAEAEETKAFLNRQLASAAPKLKDITQSTQSFVSDAVASIYGTKKTGLVDLDPAQRLGIFTQPAVIASHSGPTTTRLVKRGVFFVRKVMCLPLGVPPPGVNTTLPMTTGVTERQKVEGATTAPLCQGCHAYINPFGFMQENYDAVGRWRTTDQGLPIDASMSVDFLDEGKLATSSPVEALRTLTSSMLFQQCFARQLFRFYMGRDEGAGDDPILRQMFFGFANQGQDIVALLHSMAGSSTFSQRSETP